MAELLKVFKAITDKSDISWNNITDVDKVECFFIINRYFSKIYPEKSILLNNKDIDKIAAMDLWKIFMKSKPYPSEFWSKSSSTKKLEKGEYTEAEIILLMNKIQITLDEFNLLYSYHKELLDSELKYYKKLQKE